MHPLDFSSIRSFPLLDLRVLLAPAANLAGRDWILLLGAHSELNVGLLFTIAIMRMFSIQM